MVLSPECSRRLGHRVRPRLFLGHGKRFQPIHTARGEYVHPAPRPGDVVRKEPEPARLAVPRVLEILPQLARIERAGHGCVAAGAEVIAAAVAGLHPVIPSVGASPLDAVRHDDKIPDARLAGDGFPSRDPLIKDRPIPVVQMIVVRPETYRHVSVLSLSDVRPRSGRRLRCRR